jgi:hypothetical protein
MLAALAQIRTAQSPGSHLSERGAARFINGTSDVSGCHDLVADDPTINGAEYAAAAATTAIASTVATATAANHDPTTATPAPDTSSAATATAAAATLRGSLRAGSCHHQRCRADEAETINAAQNHPGDQPRQDAATTGWIIGHGVSLLLGTRRWAGIPPRSIGTGRMVRSARERRHRGAGAGRQFSTSRQQPHAVEFVVDFLATGGEPGQVGRKNRRTR